MLTFGLLVLGLVVGGVLAYLFRDRITAMLPSSFQKKL